MALDPSIITGIKPVQLANPLELATQAQTLRNLSLNNQAGQVSLEQNQRQLADQKTIADLYRANTDAAGNTNHAAVIQGLAAKGLGDKIPAYQSQVLGTQKLQGDVASGTANLEKTQVETEVAKAKFLTDMVGRLASTPNLTHDQVIAELAKAPPQFAQNAAQFARMLPGDPAQLHNFLITAGLSGQERLAALTPKLEQMNTGGQTQLVDQNPLTRGNAPTTFARTMTPDEQAKIDLMKSRGVFTDQSGDLLASLAARGVSLPAGMRSKEQQISTLNGLLRKFPGMSPDEIADGIATGQIDFGAAKKETTTAAAQAGRVAIAVNELKTFGDQALAASAALPRGSFVPWNQLKQMSDAQISDPALLTFKAKMQALNNAFDQLAARGGTDADKRAHIHALFNTATSQEGVAALVKALKEEGIGAKEAAADATKYHGATTKPTTTGSGATVPPDIAALLSKHGGS